MYAASDLASSCLLAIDLLQIHINQIVQAHTVLKSVVHKYANKPVLVLGGRNDVVRKVAER